MNSIDKNRGSEMNFFCKISLIFWICFSGLASGAPQKIAQTGSLGLAPKNITQPWQPDQINQASKYGVHQILTSPSSNASYCKGSDRPINTPQTTPTDTTQTFAQIYDSLYNILDVIDGYLDVFALTYGSAFIHELGHAIAHRISTGFWPEIHVGDSDIEISPIHLQLYDNVFLHLEKFALDICGKTHPSKAEWLVLIKALKQKYPGFHEDWLDNPEENFTVDQNFFIEVKSLLQSKSAAIIELIAGPLSALISLSAINHLLPEHPFLIYIWLYNVMKNFIALFPYNDSDGHIALRVAGLSINDKVQSIAKGVKTGLVEIFHAATIKEQLKYWAFGRTITNKNLARKAESALLFLGISALDYIDPTQKIADVIKSQNITWFDYLQEKARTWLPFGWGEDAIKSSVGWIGAISLYLMVKKTMPNFHPIRGTF